MYEGYLGEETKQWALKDRTITDILFIKNGQIKKNRIYALYVLCVIGFFLLYLVRVGYLI